MSTPIPNTLVNATPFDVTYIDGTTEQISLARLSIRLLYTFTQHLAGEKVPELVSLCTGKPGEWLDTIEDASFAALSQLCIQLNFPRAVTLSKSDPVIALRIMPFLQGMQTMAILTGMHEMAGLLSTDKSPAPASSGSAAESGSGVSTSPPSDSAPSSPPPTG